MKAPDGPAVAALPPLLKITQAREHGGVVVAAAQEVPDRDGAEALRGARVFVARSSFPSAGDDEYYWVDLIDCTVVPQFVCVSVCVSAYYSSVLRADALQQ